MVNNKGHIITVLICTMLSTTSYGMQMKYDPTEQMKYIIDKMDNEWPNDSVPTSLWNTTISKEALRLMHDLNIDRNEIINIINKIIDAKSLSKTLKNITIETVKENIEKALDEQIDLEKKEKEIELKKQEDIQELWNKAKKKGYTGARLINDILIDSLLMIYPHDQLQQEKETQNNDIIENIKKMPLSGEQLSSETIDLLAKNIIKAMNAMNTIINRENIDKEWPENSIPTDAWNQEIASYALQIGEKLLIFPGAMFKIINKIIDQKAKIKAYTSSYGGLKREYSSLSPKDIFLTKENIKNVLLDQAQKQLKQKKLEAQAVKTTPTLTPATKIIPAQETLPAQTGVVQTPITTTIPPTTVTPTTVTITEPEITPKVETIKEEVKPTPIKTQPTQPSVAITVPAATIKEEAKQIKKTETKAQGQPRGRAASRTTARTTLRQRASTSAKKGGTSRPLTRKQKLVEARRKKTATQKGNKWTGRTQQRRLQPQQPVEETEIKQ